MRKLEKLYLELVSIVSELREYYDIDKVKTYSVYVWTKENEGDESVFDIEHDGITMYNNSHIIKEEALPIIERIQAKLTEISTLENKY